MRAKPNYTADCGLGDLKLNCRPSDYEDDIVYLGETVIPPRNRFLPREIVEAARNAWIMQKKKEAKKKAQVKGKAVKKNKAFKKNKATKKEKAAEKDKAPKKAKAINKTKAANKCEATKKIRATTENEDLKNAVDDDGDENWLTEPESGDEDKNSDGDGSDWSNPGFDPERARRALIAAYSTLTSRDLKTRKEGKRHKIPEEPNRFIDRSFRQCLPRGIKKWEDVGLLTTEETAFDIRLNYLFGGPPREPRDTRIAYQGPFRRERSPEPGKIDRPSWAETKLFLQSEGMDTEVFDARGRETQREFDEFMVSQRTGKRFRASRDKNYKYYGDISNEEDGKENEDENENWEWEYYLPMT
ncbi:hypothetical protein TWF481_009221 [Arthrobotrys musiformis]|uniref:Uncharacterized protein n=1 Tax=Arthrobotrys musiformis TaxID=47236 RepID=A0AAV9W347_9PEZI